MTTPPGPPGDERVDAELEELRRLLLGVEQDRLQELTQRLEELDVAAEDVAAVLPDALLLEAGRGDRLGAALAPSVEEALHRAIRRNPKALADAVSPIMGPAIRRSILQAIGDMLQGFNQALEHSLSIEGLKWRIEALRTGRSFGEVVALHTLLFQVDQVFLIHKDTGLLLAHQSVQEAPDADLVGAMLVAIRDFVGDSFGGGEGSGALNTVQVGERTVWVEAGRDAILAAVVTGHAPESLRVTMVEALEQIEVAFALPLGDFDGDAEDFSSAEAILADCLVSRSKKPEGSKKGMSPVALLVWAVLIVLALTWVGLEIRDARRFSRLVRSLESEPGIVVTESDGRMVQGLMDPLARSPEALLERSPFDGDDVDLRFDSYVSAEPEMVLRRAEAALAPPVGVELSLDGGILRVTGSASQAWVDRAADLAPMIAGIATVSADESVEVVAMEGIGVRLESLMLRFATESTALREPALLESIREQLGALDSLATEAGVRARVVVTGSADVATGSAALNQSLAEGRARATLQALPASRFGSLDFEIRARLPEDEDPADARSVILTLDPSRWVTPARRDR